MKKNVSKAVFAALMILCATSMMAQESDMDDRKFRFGLHASPNLGWLRPNIQEFEKSGLQSRLGFGYGLMMDLKFSESPNYLFSTGINLTNSGGGLIEAYDSIDIVAVNDTSYPDTLFGKRDRTYRVQYVNIPLLLKMRTNEIGYMSYFAAVGIDLGVRTRAFANDEFDWTDPDKEIGTIKDVNIQDEMQLFRLGLNLTGGGEFNLSGNTNLYVGISYHNHFTNMFRKTQENRILEPDADGNPTIVNGAAVLGKQKKAVSNYVGLNVGIYF